MGRPERRRKRRQKRERRQGNEEMWKVEEVRKINRKLKASQGNGRQEKKTQHSDRPTEEDISWM